MPEHRRVVVANRQPAGPKPKNVRSRDVDIQLTSAVRPGLDVDRIVRLIIKLAEQMAREQDEESSA